MIDRYYVVNVSSDDPFAPLGAHNVVEYHFPRRWKAVRFAKSTIGQGHFATMSERLIEVEDGDY